MSGFLGRFQKQRQAFREGQPDPRYTPEGGGVNPDREFVGIPVVPFLPIRCPSCGSKNKRTHGVREGLRHHICKDCEQAYRSRELERPE